MKPDSTDPFVAQYDALLTGRGVMWLTDSSSVTLTGSDRQTFLHNFCTNDVKRLVPGQSCEAFFTNVKGKIVAHGLVTCRDVELVVIGLSRQASRLMEHLERYVIREDVQLRDTTAEHSYLLLASAQPVREFINEASPHRGDSDNPRQFFVWNLISSDGAGLVEIASHDVTAMLNTLQEQGIHRIDPAAFHAARIEAGVPLFGVDFDDRNLPQEVGRNEMAISFTKGCYLGQETVARIDALGHVNQQLAGVRFLGEDVPEQAAALTHGGHHAGHVTSASYSPRLQAPLALSMLRREHLATGTRLDSPVGECEVVALPLS
jgi:folate-binding protein YgfZ